jgi:glyoxylase-like metal-dependent hydrolase (beta-lactamase superfamily II)
MDRDAWTEPGAERVAEGIHRIPLPLPMDGLRAVNVYAIEDGDGLVLVDGGWALDVSRELLERSLAEIGYAMRDIRRVLVTHVHRDHYTQAVAIRREFGTEVSLGAEERSSMRELMEGRTGMLATQPRRLRRLGAVALADQLDAIPVDLSETLAFYEEPDVWLEPGRVELDTLALDAVHTPGHTRGHLVFHAADPGLLFAGDHVLPHITPSIGFEPDRPPFPLRDYLSSLERVLALPDAALLPAHGPAGGSSHGRAYELLAHHERRLADTRAALDAGAGLAPEAARILRWTSRGRSFDELHLFDQMLAVLETAAHLDVLVLRGDASRDESGDAVTYSVVG